MMNHDQSSNFSSFTLIVLSSDSLYLTDFRWLFPNLSWFPEKDQRNPIFPIVFPWVSHGFPNNPRLSVRTVATARLFATVSACWRSSCWSSSRAWQDSAHGMSCIFYCTSIDICDIFNYIDLFIYIYIYRCIVIYNIYT